jgi:KEOPS complex subunit Pcc1
MPERTDSGTESRDAESQTPDESDHLLEAEFEYASERRARVVAESIRVEVGEMPDERSEASVDREGRVVSAAIGAADLVALRAGTNTWLRLVGVAEDVAAAGDQRRR